MAKVISFNEQEDGSAQLTVELSDEEVGILLNDAITRAIRNYLMFEALNELHKEEAKTNE